MIKISFPANDKAAALEFGKALLAYSGETVIATTSNEVLLALKETVMVPVDSVTVGCTEETGPLTNETQVGGTPISLKEIVDAGVTGLTQVPDAAKVDTKGVEFDPDYCANAVKPYYETGAQTGQWKKKRGVTDEAYNAWYFDQLTQQGVDAPATDQFEADINVGAAFQQSNAAETTQTAATIECPADAGEYMVWVSELQAAGRISEEQLNAAYAEADIANAFTLFQEGGYAGVQKVFPIMCRMAGL